MAVAVESNSAHPFENPNPLSNMLQTRSMLVVPVALVFAFRRMVGAPRQGRAPLYTMGIFFLLGLFVLYHSEPAGNPILTSLGVDPALGNMEGGDLRFCQAQASLFAAATTGTGTGAAGATYDSMTPIGGATNLFFLLIGCITPGGVGTVLYDMLLISIIAIFIAGLMVGRTPEYLGNKIEARDICDPGGAVLHPRFEHGRRDGQVRARQSRQFRSARPDRNNLYLCGRRVGQRIVIWRDHREYARLQHIDGDRDVGRAFPVWRSNPGARRIARGQDARRAVGRHVSDARSPVRRSVGRRHRRSFDVFSGARLGPIVEHLLMLGGKTFRRPRFAESKGRLYKSPRRFGIRVVLRAERLSPSNRGRLNKWLTLWSAHRGLLRKSIYRLSTPPYN
jgi:potassium-transporting ATPase A subunit